MSEKRPQRCFLELDSYRREYSCTDIDDKFTLERFAAQSRSGSGNSRTSSTASKDETLRRKCPELGGSEKVLRGVLGVAVELFAVENSGWNKHAQGMVGVASRTSLNNQMEEQAERENAGANTHSEKEESP